MSFLRTLLMVVFIPFSMMSTSDSYGFRTCERTGAQLPKSIEQYYAPKILRDITTSGFEKSFFGSKLIYKNFRKGTHLRNCLILEADSRIKNLDSFTISAHINQSCTNNKWYGYFKYKCSSRSYAASLSDNQLCSTATIGSNEEKRWDNSASLSSYVLEAKRRGINCDVVKTSNKKSSQRPYKNYSDKSICYRANNGENKFIEEANNRNLDCLLSLEEIHRNAIAKKLEERIEGFSNQNYNSAKINPSISSKELEKEKQKRIELQRKAEEEERKRKALEQRIAELEKKNKELQQPKQIKQKPSNEIGSGFYVSKFRHIVTNQHVVNQCKNITVGDSMSTQIPADLIASDKRNDLAILQTVSMETASADTKSFVRKLAIEIVPVLSGGLMRSEDVVGGEEIFVAGFPLANQISDSLKLSDGIVSSTKGYENDVSKFEITSIVRKGNSGGPIYDKKGNIVGVVVEQVNVSRSDDVNFAIKGSTVKQFLSAHNVPSKWSNRQDKIDTKDIYKIASKQTVMVVCHRD